MGNCCCCCCCCCSSKPEPLKYPINWKKTVIIIIRRDFRDIFGTESFNQCGFFLDRHMSPIVTEYSGWLDYLNENVELKAHNSNILAQVISEDGRYLFVGSNHVITCLDLESGHSIRQFDVQRSNVMCLGYGNGLLVIGCDDKSLSIWDAYELRRMEDHIGIHSDIVTVIKYDHLSKCFITCSKDKTIRMWSDWDFNCKMVLKGHTNQVTDVAWSQSLIVSCSNDHFLRVWDRNNNGQCIEAWKPRGHANNNTNALITGVDLNADGTLIGCCIPSIGLLIYETREFTEVCCIPDCNSNCVRFHPLIPSVVATSNIPSNDVKLFDPCNGREICSFEWNGRGHVLDLRFTPDGSHIISIDYSPFPRIWCVRGFLHY